MADKTVTVITTGGGDYTSLNAAFSGEDGAAFDAYTGVLNINCSGSDADTTPAVFGASFASQSATHYVSVVGDNDTGKKDTSKYRVDFTSSTGSNTPAIDMTNALYAKIKNIGISVKAASNYYRTYYGIYSGTDNSYLVIDSNVIYDIGVGGENNDGYGIYFGRSLTIRNNIIYNVNSYGIREISGYGSAIAIQNNTVYNYNIKTGGSGIGIGLSANTTNAGNKLQNNLVIAGAGGGPCYSFNAGITDDHNGSSDTSGDIDNLTAADLFVSVTGGSEDLHLKAGADAIDAGVGPGADAGIPTLDIDGDTRSGNTCDIGADEYVAAGGSIVPLLMKQYRSRRQ